MNYTLIAQLAFAGAMVGFLIGPGSLNQFIGVAVNNTVFVNILVGGLVGALLGVIGSFSKEVD